MLPVAPTTRTVMGVTVKVASLLSGLAALGCSRRSDLVDDPQRVERAGISDEWQ